MIAQLVRAPSRFEGTDSARADSVGSNPTQAYFSSIMATRCSHYSVCNKYHFSKTFHTDSLKLDVFTIMRQHGRDVYPLESNALSV